LPLVFKKNEFVGSILGRTDLHQKRAGGPTTSGV
jgi:hypothetical protein